MDIKVWLVFSTSLCTAYGMETFSLLKINTDDETQIDICHFTSKTQDSQEILAICGYKGESCSIAVHRNKSEAHVRKDIKCDCLEQVFPGIDQAYHGIPAPDYSLPINSQSGDTVTGHNMVGTLINGALLRTSSNYKYIELDGVDDYIDLGDNSNSCLGNVELCPSGLTLSMWILPEKLENGRQWYFGTAKIDSVGLVITHENQILRVRVMDTKNHWVSLSYQLTAKWTLITVTWIKHGVLSVYIDGCLFEVVGSVLHPNTHDPRTTLIGKSATHNLHYAGVLVDEFMFWERVLKASEVMSVYINDRA